MQLTDGRQRSYWQSYLLVTLPVLLILIIFIFLLLLPAYEDEIARSNADTLLHVSQLMDRLVFEPMQQLTLDIASDRDFDGFLLPLREDPEEHLVDIYNARLQLARLRDQGNGLYESISIYYPGQGLINSSRGYRFLDHGAKRFPDFEWLSYADAFLADDPMGRREAWLLAAAPRQPDERSDLHEEVLHYLCVFPFSKQAKEYNGLIAIGLRTEAIREILRDRLDITTSFYIYTASGQKLFSTAPEDALAPFHVQDITAAPVDASVSRMPSATHITSRIASQRNGLFYVYSVPKSDFGFRASVLQRSVLLAIAFCVATACALAYVAARRASRPIERTIDSMRRILQSHDLKAQESASAFETIDASLQTLSNRLVSLNEYVERNKPIMVQSLLNDLLHRHQRNASALEERMHMLGLPITDTTCCLAIVSLQPGEDGRLSAEELRMEAFRFIAAYAPLGRVVPILLRDEDIALPLLEAVEDIHALLDTLHRELSAYLDMPPGDIRIAYSPPVTHPMYLFQCRKTVERILQYAYLLPDSILHAQSIAAHEHNKNVGLFDPARLSQHMRQGPEEAIAYTTKCVAALEKAKPSMETVRNTLTAVMTTTLATLRHMGREPTQEAAAQWIEAYQRSRHIGAFLPLYADFVMSVYSPQADGHADQQLIDQICDYVKAHPAEDLSLRAIAGRFYISYAHLSRVFKECKQMNYTDFVLTMRMEKAAALLCDARLRVEDVAERVGYRQVSYFIRIFRESYGITPGQYQKQRIRSL